MEPGGCMWTSRLWRRCRQAPSECTSVGRTRLSPFPGGTLGFVGDEESGGISGPSGLTLVSSGRGSGGVGGRVFGGSVVSGGAPRGGVSSGVIGARGTARGGERGYVALGELRVGGMRRIDFSNGVHRGGGQTP